MDINLDGSVTIQDVTLSIDMMLSGDTSGGSGDVNSDGSMDVQVWRALYSKCVCAPLNEFLCYVKQDVVQMLNFLVGG